MATGEDQLTITNLQVTGKALDALTTTAADHTNPADPAQTLHLAAHIHQSHSWLSKFFPSTYIDTIEASYHLGNYVIDRRSGEKSFEAMSIYVRLGMHLLYYGTAQEKVLHMRQVLDILKEQTDKMGKEYDKPESVAHILPFIESFELQAGLAELQEPDPSKYPTFNAFFARALRPDARPVEQLQDQLVVCSPADCRLTAFPSVDLATKYWIKGFGFTLERLFGSAELAAQFEGGSIVIARLAPQDYHRWHSPVDGTVKSVTDIPGTYYTVNPQAINESGTLDVFCENKRSVMLVERAQTKSQVAIIAVGAMLVGSIKYLSDLDKPGSQIQRGQSLGAFYYGGSTVIVVYPRGEVVLDEDLVRNSTEQVCETLVKVGWRTGRGPASQATGTA